MSWCFYHIFSTLKVFTLNVVFLYWKPVVVLNFRHSLRISVLPSFGLSVFQFLILSIFLFVYFYRSYRQFVLVLLMNGVIKMFSFTFIRIFDYRISDATLLTVRPRSLTVVISIFSGENNPWEDRITNTVFNPSLTLLISY